MEYSVLMTVYKNDNPKYFEEALQSMINQTKKPNEIVLVKDGPVPKIIQEVIDATNTKFGNIKQVQLKTNVGLGLALNAGIKVCKNELIARMDADDISLPTRCEKQVKEFERNKDLDIIGCPVIEFVDNSSNVVGKRNVPITNEEIYEFAKTRDPFNHPTVMYKKSIIESVGCYGNLRKNQDTDLWLKLLINNANCSNLEEPLLLFRFDKATYKKRKNWLNTKLLISIRWKCYKNHFCSLFDFLQVAIMQFAIYFMPTSFQEFVYKYLLRR